MAYAIDLCSLDGATTLASGVSFRSARATWSLDGPGAIEVALRRDRDVPGEWLAGRRRILLKKDGSPLWAGVHTNTSRAGPPSDPRYTAAGLGLASLLGGMVVHGAFYASETATAIAWDLIANAQAQPGGDWGLTDGPVHGAAPTRNRYYCEGDRVSEAIAELAAFKAGGFDWCINADGSFERWVGGRGADRTATHTLRESDATDWAVEEETADLLTYVTAFGRQGTGPCDEVWRTRSSALAAAYGRREDVIQLDTTDEAADLDDAADEELRARGGASRRLAVSWIEGRGPWAFGEVGLGDTVTVELEPVFGGTQPMRLVTTSLSLESRHEFVEHELEAVV